jgi:hypothetical protein
MNAVDCLSKNIFSGSGSSKEFQNEDSYKNNRDGESRSENEKE